MCTGVPSGTVWSIRTMTPSGTRLHPFEISCPS
jgi:hypothetical protein